MTQLNPATSIRFTTGGPGWKVEDGSFKVGIAANDGNEETLDQITFTVPQSFVAHPDCVAAALSTLCGNRYASVNFDFPISERAHAMISAGLGVEVRFAGETIPPREGGRRVALNFSGGMDSLAALALADRDLQLISMGFGGDFVREETYFTRFPTVAVHTDFRRKGYGKADWRFMGAGSLLLADTLDLDRIGFGTIFEATPWNFHWRNAGAVPRLAGPFGALGIVNSSWILGLTEVGTAMAVLAYLADEVPPSLASLAALGSEKYYRKQLLIRIAARRLGRPEPELGELVEPKAITPFGSSFAVDFLALFIAKELGQQFARKMVGPIPDDAEVKDVLRRNLDFYTKYNPNFIGHMPPEMRNGVLNRMHMAEILPFNQTDFESLAAVGRLLSRYHNVPLA